MYIQNCKIIIAGFLLLFLLSCVKDKPPVIISPVDTSAHKILIVCEGVYGNGNSSLYTYNTLTDSVSGDVYESVNKQGLGDILQSACIIEDKLFLCVNNSNKIVAVNKNTFAFSGTINIPQPRYILPVNSGKAYVSSLYSDKLYVINPQSLQISDTLTLPYSNPENMLLVNNKAYICCWDTANRFLYKYNTENNTLESSVALAGYAPHTLALDKENTLWVMSGNVYKNKKAFLTRLHLNNEMILQDYSFGTADPIRLEFNPAKDTLYFIEVNYDGALTNNGIYRMAITENAIPQEAFIKAKSLQYFWAIGVDPKSGHIYVGDPKGFTQRGEVYKYNVKGELLHQFKVGLGPNGFYF